MAKSFADRLLEECRKKGIPVTKIHIELTEEQRKREAQIERDVSEFVQKIEEAHKKAGKSKLKFDSFILLAVRQRPKRAETIEEKLKRLEAPKNVKPKLYPIKTMGTLSGEKMIFLHSSFLKDKMGARQLDAAPIMPELRLVRKIRCPFCKQGILEVVEIKPLYSGGRSMLPGTMHHSGNEYKFKCSNPDCSGKFFGQYKWLWID